MGFERLGRYLRYDSESYRSIRTVVRIESLRQKTPYQTGLRHHTTTCPSPTMPDRASPAADPDSSSPTAEKELRDTPLDHFGNHYPDWAREFARKYFTKTLNQFVLYGNVRDLIRTVDMQGNPTYVPLRKFLTDDLFAARDIVVFYDRSSGIHFADKASRQDFNRAVSGYDTIHGTEYAQKLPKEPARVFALLENYFRLRLNEGKRIACVIDYAETVVPMSEASMASTDDRRALVFLQRWSHDSLFLRSDFTTCLIAENLSDLHQRLVQSPWTVEIELPIPSDRKRRSFTEWYLEDREHLFEEHADVTVDQVMLNSAGLNLIQLRTILADVIENRVRLTFDVLSEMKKEMIEEAAYGLLEFVETDYTLDMVAGHREAKQHLRDAARALRNNRPDVMPMGYLVSGPVGTGKTFLITCFAGEIGIPMVKLKNFRSQWQGVTEGNLEKILGLLQAMTPVAVMIDEADAALGNRDAQGDSGVSARVFGKIAAFMSNPAHRGRIIFFLLTARPDLMPVDLKRQGRAEEHLALFYPSTREDREELLQVMMRRTGVDLPMDEVPEVLINGDKTLSGADMEALLTRAKFVAAARADGEGASTEDTGVTAKILQHVVDDFIPPTYPVEVELQTLSAVLECTSRELLPERYRQMDRETIIRQVEELKALV